MGLGSLRGIFLFLAVSGHYELILNFSDFLQNWYNRGEGLGGTKILVCNKTQSIFRNPTGGCFVESCIYILCKTLLGGGRGMGPKIVYLEMATIFATSRWVWKGAKLYIHWHKSWFWLCILESYDESLATPVLCPGCQLTVEFGAKNIISCCALIIRRHHGILKRFRLAF